ncbi:hypothetical protein ABT297_24495 [Dactylosporangium sp. NPDC000555]|uniref:DUF7933 domain-containing protein n=1 Tax=Dactylosporangium sp. NPDC000555 TaxID=3154260 RepID=UPI00333124E8
MAMLATCGALAVPQAGFAAVAQPTADGTGSVHSDSTGRDDRTDRTNRAKPGSQTELGSHAKAGKKSNAGDQTKADSKATSQAKAGGQGRAGDQAKADSRAGKGAAGDQDSTLTAVSGRHGSDKAQGSDKTQSQDKTRGSSKAQGSDKTRGSDKTQSQDKARGPSKAHDSDKTQSQDKAQDSDKTQGSDKAQGSDQAQGVAGALGVAPQASIDQAGVVQQACMEGMAVEVSAAWSDATIEDHEVTALVVTLSRPDVCGAVSGVDLEIELPAPLYRAQGSHTATCSTTAISAPAGSSELSVTGAGMADEVESCTISFPVRADKSGTYELTSAHFTGVNGAMVNQTPQTLTVTTAPAMVGAGISPSTIVALGVSRLSVRLARTDENASAVSSGLGFRVNLPEGVTIGAGDRINNCGGTLTAATETGFLTLAGASLTGFPAHCELSVPVTSAIAGHYEVDNTSVVDTSGVVARIQCAERGRAEVSCGATLDVEAKGQTVDFTQPANSSVSKHTVPLVATASSGLPVTFTSSTPLVCTVSGATATLVDAGTCTIAADQAGDPTYSAATQVTRSFTVSGATPPPTSVVATGGPSSISVTWQAPGDLSGVTGYTAIANPGPATCSTTSATATTCVMGGTAGVTYTVTVVTNNQSGDSVASGPSNAATPTAPAIPSTPPDTNLTLTTDQGLITTAEPGQNIVVIGTGFMPHSTATIVIYSTPIELGTVVTDGQGNFSKPVRVPPDLAAGGHVLVATGIGPNGQPHSLKMAITVQAQGGGGSGGGGGGGDLAVTGAPIAALLQLGMAAVFGGGTLLLTGRKRRRT